MLSKKTFMMKILHTSDWHLGHTLYNYDRTDEEAHVFRQLADLVESERPDALVVSGDVFHTGVPGNDVAKGFTDRLFEVVSRSPGTEAVVIAGNHDSYSRLVVDETLWRHCRVHVLGTPAEDADGNALLDGNIVELPGKGYVAAVPFCHGRNFPMVPGSDGSDRAKAYFAALAARLAERNAERLPCVLAAHLAVGRDTCFAGQDRHGVIGGEECVDPETLGPGYDYIALGHIHCPQWVKGGRRLARYCGTPRAVHFDETYPHGVDVVEVAAGREPSARTVEFAPLHALVTLGGDDGLPFDDVLGQVAGAALPENTYVRLNVRLGAGELPGPDWAERARRECLAHRLRFCLNNLVRTASPEKKEDRKALTMAELKELSNDEVLRILSARHELSERQRALLGSLMEEAGA